MDVKEALHRAYTEEAKAAVRLRIYAEKAAQEGYIQMAKLFEAVARSEETHATRALKLLAEIGDTEANLARSFEVEESIAQAAYGEFVKIAEKEGDQAASLHFSQSRDVEETHANLYKKALNHFLEEREVTYWVCGLCGFIAEERAPEECPICGMPREKFFNV